MIMILGETNLAVVVPRYRTDQLNSLIINSILGL
jgi:hypothetical protein